MYLLGALANLRIPALAPSAGKLPSPVLLVRELGSAVRPLMGNPDSRFSLLGTSIFGSTGSTLRFLLVAWVLVALGLMDTSTPASLSVAVAVGIALGAAAAARFVSLGTVNGALLAGLALGVLTMAFAQVTSLPLANGLPVTIGACGGFYVGPLNALLQERGQESDGAGSAIAVQNLFENLVMLVMVGAYAAMTHAGMPPDQMAMVFGGVVLAGLGAVAM